MRTNPRNKVVAIMWDATREAHGTDSGVVGTNWCSLWITEGWDWSEPIWDKVEAIRWDIALGTDPDIHNMLILALGIDVC